MPRRYTLSECYRVLDVDAKTFRSWLRKAGMESQVSRADPRVKYLTEDQVRILARDHERDLERAKRQPEVIPPNAYKNLREQVEQLEQQIVDLVQRQIGVYEELQENIALVEARQQQASEGLHATVKGAIEEMRRGVDLAHQQHESLVELSQQQAARVDQVRAGLAGSREDVRLVRVQSEAAETRQLRALQELRQTGALDLRQAMDELRREGEKLLEQRVREVHTALEGLNKGVAADMATITERVDQGETRREQLTTQLDAVKIMALGAKPRVDAQDQVIADLQAQLQRERDARELLAEQVAMLLREKTEGRLRKKPGV